MELHDEHVYPVPVDDVMAMLHDKSATIEKYESMGHRDVQLLELDADETSVRIKSSRVVDVDLPGFAKKVLKPTNTMVQTDEWRRADPDTPLDPIELSPTELRACAGPSGGVRHGAMGEDAPPAPSVSAKREPERPPAQASSAPKDEEP